uniref:Uncharacterized protein n=1 Tax=Odontella aurita TaxID=265563 RepID=A0A7S4IKB5_9STRA|mmetsp:Transcript_26382/g.78005  ORF Transcript_26382/g.78005 Transcript_26382/m.78005 type:complete len:141 (+) Transcript_26382:24-446(+)
MLPLNNPFTIQSRNSIVSDSFVNLIVWQLVNSLMEWNQQLKLFRLNADDNTFCSCSFLIELPCFSDEDSRCRPAYAPNGTAPSPVPNKSTTSSTLLSEVRKNPPTTFLRTEPLACFARYVNFFSSLLESNVLRTQPGKRK